MYTEQAAGQRKLVPPRRRSQWFPKTMGMSRFDVIRIAVVAVVVVASLEDEDAAVVEAMDTVEVVVVPRHAAELVVTRARCADVALLA
jgi:hypothetical protein